MKVYGKLEVAQLEWFTLAARPAASAYPYRVVFITDLAQAQISDGTSWISIGANASGGAAGVDVLFQKLGVENAGIITSPVDFTMGLSGSITPNDQYHTATLLQQYTSGDANIEIVWDATSVNDSDLNIDATTNWSAQNAGASLTTSATAKVGAASLAFDKNGTNVAASIRYDRGAQTLNVSSNYRTWFYINLPTVTGVASVALRMYADSTSNYRTYTKTTQFDGSALATGWNLILVDMSDTTGSTTGGTGWTIASLSRYQEVEVVTTLAATTLTSVKLDSLYFSLGDPTILGSIGTEFTLYNTTTKDNFVIATTNTRYDGRLTLDATLSNTYVGGLTGSTKGNIERSVLATANQASVFNDDSSFGGANTLAQSLRQSMYLRESVSKTYTTVIDMLPVQRYAVTVVGGSTISVSDVVNDSANLVTGNTVEIFRPQKVDGKTFYRLIGSRALTANATNGSSVTVLTVDPTSVAVGDIVCKRAISEYAVSVVAESAKEAFVAQTVDTAPNGVQLIEGFTYPNDTSVWAHFSLGDVSQTEAARNKKGVGSNLTATGAINFSDTFLDGRFSASGFTGSGINYSMSDANSVDIQGDDEMVQISGWFKATAFTGTNRTIIGKRNTAFTTGWTLSLDSGTNVFLLETRNGTRASGSFTPNTWTHFFALFNGAGTLQALYLNSTLVGTDTTTPPNASTELLYIGRSASGANFAVGVQMADFIIWRNGSQLSQSQITALYNRGAYFNTFKREALRYKYVSNNQSGQRVSTRLTLARTTTAIKPAVLKIGIAGA